MRMEAVHALAPGPAVAAGGSPRGPGGVWRTVDGGQSWTQVFTPQDDLHDISFADRSTGWAVGELGTVYRTADSGQTWMREGAHYDPLFTFPEVAFVSPDSGWAGGVPFLDGAGVWRRTGWIPTTFALRHGRLARGRLVTLETAGLQASAPAWFLASLAGVGSGPCVPQLGGLCLDLLASVQVLDSARADSLGVARLPVPVP